MMISSRSLRGAAAGVIGAGAVTGALLFGGAPVAQAAPGPAAGTSFAVAGPHGGPGMFPDRPGWGHGGWGHGGWGRGGLGHGGWGHGGWGRGWGFWGHRHWWNWWW
ncbi:hypothetical protein [Mycobacterium sp. 94-17]|uniref:hypothetical protein n=1 Tax=Mycobacterium sp. 94-17 TaxID=2986147 RepID=UPI002D1F951D|nr:hypothetical protein [Mycobacterium sp. 94-17]MEB4208961.1 hypothetical protein [Mycobacterium sp. 94-17]